MTVRSGISASTRTMPTSTRASRSSIRPPNPLPIEGYAKHTAVDRPLVNSCRASKRAWDTSTTRRSRSSRAGMARMCVRSARRRILDFSTSYQVNDSFGMRLQISNLTDEPLRITRDNNDEPARLVRRLRPARAARFHVQVLKRLANRETLARRAMLSAPFSWRNHESTRFAHCVRSLPASPCLQRRSPRRRPTPLRSALPASIFPM